VLLAHPGGPYWRKRDRGAWTIPKGEIGEGEDALAAAQREFSEETGLTAGEPRLALTPLRQPGGKTVFAWAVEGDCDPGGLRSNRFTLEWPPGSGKYGEFPEIDRAAWFTLPEARQKMLKGQAPFLDELEKRLSD
jgi:predicted NUDIX family NTP pyrophosphohydrolase